MKPLERYKWIEDWLRRGTTLSGQPETVDVLHRYFVDDYVFATKAKVKVMPFGADKCPQLGRDLSAMHKQGRLQRYPSGIWNMTGMGFPRWVFVYKLVDNTKG